MKIGQCENALLISTILLILLNFLYIISLNISYMQTILLLNKNLYNLLSRQWRLWFDLKLD